MRIQDINLLIFDCDGVIVDSAKDIANAVRSTQKHFGWRELSTEEITTYLGLGPEVLIQKSFMGAEEALVVAAVSFYKKYYLEHCTLETKLYPNVEKTLRSFSHKKIAMVTNKPQAQTLRILEFLGVLDCFGKVISPDLLSKTKPDPEGIFKVLEHFGQKPQNAMFIGDSIFDIMAGKAAGTKTCAVTYGYGEMDQIKQLSPDFIIEDMAELTNII